MSIFFKPSYMNEIMEKFCPEGETVLLAVYGVGKSTEINQYFGGCANLGDKLVPADSDNVIKVFKRKVCVYDNNADTNAFCAVYNKKIIKTSYHCSIPYHEPCNRLRICI